MPSKVWVEIAYPIPKLQRCNPLKFASGSNFIPHCMIDAITYACWDWSYTSLHKSLMTELSVGKNTGAEPLCVCINVFIVNMFEINCKYIVMAGFNKFNTVVHFYTPYDQTDDRRQTSPTNCNQPASGRQHQGSPAHIYRKDVKTNKI